MQDSRAATTDKAKSRKRKITAGKEEERKTTQQCKFAQNVMYRLKNEQECIFRF